MSERTVAIVQARMGSTRFPGKMMASLADRPLIEWVLRRVQCASFLHSVVLATSREPNNDRLVHYAQSLGVEIFRGDEHDVLGRFCAAAEVAKASTIVRVCADNPFIAPEEIDRIIVRYNTLRPDYAFNHVPRLGNNYANGFGAEVISRELLDRLNVEARLARYREHVTAYISDNPETFQIATMQAPSEIAFPELSFDIDEPGDLRALEKCAIDVGIEGAAAEFVRVRRRQLGLV